ncbi:MAG: hypothetical protein HGB31_02185 [Erysipelotrichaceae bacterium]|nr:hypothetical protein [Erysipelotrichaceae bacterium]
MLLGACTATAKPNTDPGTTDQTGGQTDGQTGGQTVTEYSTKTLSAFNGKNGAKAYIAVSGKVYDVTNVAQWKNGGHKGYTAGVDLTAAFANSPHTASLLATLEVVGSFVK